MIRSCPAAFTLIELLVVVTIVVILLALLTPAMDRAIYQAEMAMCATRIHGITHGVIAYASSFNRRYPQHRAASTGEATPNAISGALSPTNSAKVDMRPVLRDFVSLNGHLNCPMSEEVDIEGSDKDTAIAASYGLWFGWQFRIGTDVGKAMNKIGDKVTWLDDAFDVLAADDEVFDLEPGVGGHGSHPDDAGLWTNVVFQDEMGPWGPVPFITLSWWESTQGPRGLLDLNYGFQDGSVARYDDVEAGEDPDLVSVPARNTSLGNIRRRLPLR